MIEKLRTVDAETLLSTPMKKTEFIVDTLLPQGVSVISGASKIGKSRLIKFTNDGCDGNDGDLYTEDLPS